MGSQFDLGSRGSRARLRDDFISGMDRFESDDYAAALALFREADESAAIDDVYQNRYTSFHGLARVFMGDVRGVKLCRKAAVGETNDAEVYCNLAMAENKLGQRESAYQALRRGLRIAPEHAGLLQLKKEINLREQSGLIKCLKRENWFNCLLGILFRGSRKPYSDR
jgi:tetratricopeptide (TPR) repeat protein